VVENRPGANANIGADMVAKSTPDGYTLAFTTSGPLANNRYLYKALPYDPIKDFAPIVLVAEVPLLLVVNPKVEVKNIAELVILARANPGHLNAGSTGNGAINHLTLEMFKSIAKVDLVHVPFKGTPTGELIAGNIQVLFEPITSSLRPAQTGTLRALAVTDRTRFSALPEVPTAIEQGFDIEASVYYAMVGPAGMPQPVISRLNAEINEFLDISATRAKFSELGAVVIGGPPERVRSMIETESKKWKQIIESSGVRLD
jgi:tripartite-type tricarboxylate transporter receptor subunit TctC